jgi:hypothetical protein
MDTKLLGCDRYDDDHGTYTAEEFRPQQGAARQAAHAGAGPGALAAALAAVAQWACPKKCPQLKLTIRLSGLYQLMSDPATATLEDGTIIKGYVGRCSCDWDVRAECVTDEITALDPTGPGGGVDDPPVEAQALECDEEFVGRGRAFGAGVDVWKDPATLRAREAAAANAHAAAMEAINKIACIKRSCPARKITMWIGPASVTSAAALKGVTIAVAVCAWAIRVTCEK